MHRILFLCMGNICRSPAAHCVLQHMVNETAPETEFEIDSAGTIGFHAGAPPDPRMQQVMQARGIPVIGHSRQLQYADLEHYDRILAMDQQNLEDARRLDPAGIYHEKIQLFCTFCPDSELTEVPDPYYGGDQGFEDVLRLIESGCRNLLNHLVS